MNGKESDTEWWRGEAQRKQQCIERVAQIIGTLYSERGEDPLIAELCREVKGELEMEGA